jgi:membrane protein YqaA with SNARE-associated domain
VALNREARVNSLFLLTALKNILKRYTTWIWKVLAPLGPWGVFAIAAVDGALFGMPVDAVVAAYVYNDRRHFLFYVVMASAGSALGNLVMYAIGYFGGETVLRKRISPDRFNRIHASFESHEFWAVMFPAMLPPPFPFKLFVLAASAFEMRFTHFLAAVFAGRFVRFFVLAILTIQFGPQVVHLVGSLVRQHVWWVVAGVAVAITLGGLFWWKQTQKPTSPSV